MEKIKIWSKWKLLEVSKFLISSIGQNRKLGSLGNRHFFLLKSHHKSDVFYFVPVFRFWVSYTTKNLSQIKLSKISKFSILGIGQNRKLGNLRSWHVFFSKHIKLMFFILGHFSVSFWILSFIYYQKYKWQKTFRDFRVFNFGYRVKSKTRKARKLLFFLLKTHGKANVFFFWVLFQSVFTFRVSYTIKNLGKRKLSEISEFSILGTE